MHASYYALAALLSIYLIVLTVRYFSLSNNSLDFKSNTTQINGTSVFVALIQRVNSPVTNVKTIRENWLDGIDNFAFSEKEGTWCKSSRRIRFPATIREDVPQIRWIAAYLTKVVKTQANWLLVVPDDSYIVLENLMSLVPKLNSDVPAYSVVGNKEENKIHMVLLNRPALEFLAKAYSINVCTTPGLKSLHSCLRRLGRAKKFNIEQDSNGNKHFLVQKRHMMLNELSIMTKNEQYSDGNENFEALSDNVHSFYNLNSKEIIWYHALSKVSKRLSK